MSKNKVKVERICLSTLKSRGWTPKLINELLPEPMYVRNPHYQSSADMQLWDLDDVIEAEENELFQKRLKKREENKQKKQNLKLEKIQQMTENINTRNPALDYPNARKLHRHFILNIGATNTGKTYTALQALKKAESGVYLAPLRLLAMEIQDRLMDEEILCSMITGEEENMVEGANIMSSTVEMINLNKKYEVGIIDECQMIADRDRGGSWTRAILGLAAETIYLCMSPDAKEICIKLIKLCGDTYEINECVRTTPLKYTGSVQMEKLQKHDAVILFSRKDVLQFAKDIQRYGLKPSVVYGALPYNARKNQVEMYNKGETDIIVATDAIGMGMNLPIKRVVFAETAKFDGITRRELYPSEIKQIAGRAGRQGIFNEGNVGILSYIGPTKIIQNGLKKRNSTIQFAHIPFPEEVLKNSNEKLSQILNRWGEVQYPDIFHQQNLEVTIEKCKYLEKHYKCIDKYLELKLATIMFDERNEELMEKWMWHVYNYMTDREIEFPHAEAYDLKGYEFRYKELDLYYSFNRSMDLPMDVEKVMGHKEMIVEKINQLLLETNKSKKKKSAKPSKRGRKH